MKPILHMKKMKVQNINIIFLRSSVSEWQGHTETRTFSILEPLYPLAFTRLHLDEEKLDSHRESRMSLSQESEKTTACWGVGEDPYILESASRGLWSWEEGRNWVW